MKIIDIYTEIGYLPLWGDEYRSENLLKSMQLNGVMGSVVCPTASLADFEEANSITFELIKSNPRFLGVLTVNLDYYNESCEQLRKYLVNPNFIAVKLCSEKEITLNDCDAFLNVHRRYGTPVFIDGYSGSDAIRIGEIAKEFNQMKFLMLGMGGEDYRTAVSVARKNVNIYLETGGSLDPFKIKYAVENIGSHRLVYGSHTPYFENTVYRSLIENSGVETRDKTDIYYNSAKRLFNWK
ncbi:MAG: amidohydrolase family protein [Armatimonadetes bacterium]|nr:amidohydrolase family protein [Candidatus Hippobium faecium]